MLALHQSELVDVQLKERMSSDGVKLTRAKIIHLNSYQRARTVMHCTDSTALFLHSVERVGGQTYV